LNPPKFSGEIPFDIPALIPQRNQRVGNNQLAIQQETRRRVVGGGFRGRLETEGVKTRLSQDADKQVSK